MNLEIISDRDIDYVLEKTNNLWVSMKNANLFLTGGTGFFGIWLTSSFLAANLRYKLNATITVLSRNPENFYKNFPQLKQEKSLILLKGNICDFMTDERSYTHIIHAATEVSDKLNKENPLLMLETITEGTKQILEFAKDCKRLQKFLFISSGAVYGNQSSDLESIPETYLGAPDPLNTNTAYANSKRFSEHMTFLYGKKYSFPVNIARCFAFVGPYLPLDTHFAIGNFIQDALNNKDILIKGNGLPMRSYLYAADLAISLWYVLLLGESGKVYNVGSDEAISIKDLASLVVKICNPTLTVTVAGNSKLVGNSSRYIPNVLRLYEELKVPKPLNLIESIHYTFEWYKKRGLKRE